MKKKSVRTLVCFLLVGMVMTAFVAMAAGVGSQGDPLVTLSYLNETFMGEMLEKFDQKISSRNETMRQEIKQTVDLAQKDLLGKIGGNVTGSTGGVAASYTQVELSAGQILYGEAGCEVLLRSGKALCVAADKTTPGMVDTTDGGSVNDGGSLKTNHLYLMPVSRGVQAGGAVTLLVRGTYSIG